MEEVVGRAGGRRRVRRALGVPSDRRISDEVIDELLAGASSEEEIAGSGGLLADLTKRLIERAIEVELTEHVGYEPRREPPGRSCASASVVASGGSGFACGATTTRALSLAGSPSGPSVG